jgi:cell division protein FtsW (lipid II flippase)
VAAGALLTLILGFSVKKFSRKAMLLVSSTFMFLAMAYSGTRTAYSVIPAGVILFVLMTITRRNTLIFACFFLAVFVVIIWGPIYGNPTINRIRSTFEFSEEASMKVRDINRKNIQPYIYTHPIGGGLATSGMQGLEYNPAHYLAGFPPDSGFLRTAVETGWIGLALQCLLYFIIIQSGVRVFYQSNDKKIKMYALAITIPLFCFIVAQYAQVSIGQIPGCFVFYPGLAMIARLKNFISEPQVNQKQLI